MSPQRVLLLWVACLAGCRGEPSTTSSEATEQPNGRTASVHVDTAHPDQPPSSVHDGTADVGQDHDADPSSPPGTPVPVPQESRRQELEDAAGRMESSGVAAQVPSPSPERLLCLIPGGPLIVDLMVTIEGQPHDTALRRFVANEMAAADLDEDGHTTWREVANHTPYRYGQFRYNPIPILRRFDGNRDGLVAPDELLAFLMRNTGMTQSFLLRSVDQYPYDDSETLIWQTLDDDRDGILGPGDLAQAPTRLLQADDDDDEVLRRIDVHADRTPANRIISRRRADQPEVVLRIHQKTSWSNVAFALSERYAFGGALTTDLFSLTPGLFDGLDVDHDQTIDDAELAGIGELPPHLLLRADFGDPRMSRGPTTAQLRLEKGSESTYRTGATIGQYANRILVTLPGVRVQFFVNEDSMLYHTSVEAVDTDRDGKISEYELAGFLDRRQPVCRGLVRAWATRRDQSLFAALDADGDGQLAARELHQSSRRLRSLDRNHDGQLEAPEIPASMVVGFVRGNPLRDNDLFVFPPVATPDPSTPGWFTAMDANGDGEISRREFLGSRDQFRLLDRDGDGYIGLSEGQGASGV